MEHVLFFIVTLSFASLITAWIIFRVSSMRRIEAKVRAEGRDRTGWDGIGARIAWYALVIWLPITHRNWMNNPLIDVEAVRRHATARDRKLAGWFTLSGWIFTVSGLLLAWLIKTRL